MLVVIAEKPSAARKFAAALGGRQGTFNGEEYRICALLGHVMELLPPAEQVGEDERERIAKWAFEFMPWDARKMAFKKKPTDSGKKALSELSEALKSCDEAVIATDVDPSGEGELLAWEALEWCGWDGRTSRMYFYDEEAPTIQAAFKNRKVLAGMHEDGDWRKADCRSRWDFMSMQFSRISTLVARERGHRCIVRQGRLKSVMVWFVGEAIAAREKYVKTPFYEARFKDENGNIFSRDSEEAERFKSAEEVDLSGLHPCGVTVDSETVKHSAPGALLDLLGMSSILAAKGYDSAKVMDVYQKMYEAGVVSYPRTEDKTMSAEQFNELLPLADRIAECVGVDKGLLTYRKPRKKHVKEGCTHGANRPGPNVPDSLDAVEKEYGTVGRAVYELLARNYLAILAPDYEYLQIKAHASDFAEYKSSINIPQFAGFKAVFDADAESSDEAGEDEQSKGFGESCEPFVHEGFNKKPPRPTMKWLKTRLEKNNVGTGATRTSILNDVKGKDDRALLTEKKGVLGLTEVGEVSYILLEGTKIADVAVTEQLFEAMERVANEGLDADEIVDGVAGIVEHDMQRMRDNAGKLPQGSGGAARKEIAKCPVCGEAVWLGKKSCMCSSNKFVKDGDTWKQQSGCGFKIGLKFMGKKLTEAQLARAIAGERVAVNGLKSAAGKSYGAYAKLSDGAGGGGWWRFEMDGFVEKKSGGRKKRGAGSR